MKRRQFTAAIAGMLVPALVVAQEACCGMPKLELGDLDAVTARPVAPAQGLGRVFVGFEVGHFVDHQAAVSSPIAELIKRYRQLCDQAGGGAPPVVGDAGEGSNASAVSDGCTLGLVAYCTVRS